MRKGVGADYFEARELFYGHNIDGYTVVSNQLVRNDDGSCAFLLVICESMTKQLFGVEYVKRLTTQDMPRPSVDGLPEPFAMADVVWFEPVKEVRTYALADK